MITQKVSSPEAYKLFHDGTLLFAEIERTGIRIDVPHLEMTINNTEQRIKRLEDTLRKHKIYQIWQKIYGQKTNLDSGTQLARILFDELKVKCNAYTRSSYDEKGNLKPEPYRKPSTAEEDLKHVDHPFVRKLFKVKHLKKTVGTFLKGIRRETIDGVLHTVFNLHTVRTMRSSSSDINWQNLPKRDKGMARLVRDCIIPREGNIVWEADFKGIEVCCAATITKDKALMAYVTDSKLDMHRDAAADLFLFDVEYLKQHKDWAKSTVRDWAKNRFVFPQFYGSVWFQCAPHLWEAVLNESHKLPGTDKSIKEHLKEHGIKRLGNCEPGSKPEKNTFSELVWKAEDSLWNKRFKGYTAWKKDFYSKYLREGGFTTVTGFRINGFMRRNQVLNTPIQGPAFHCLLYTLIRLNPWLKKEKLRTKIIGQVHDSGNFDSPPEEFDCVADKIQDIVKNDLPNHWKWISVPMSVEIEASDINGSWGQKKEMIRNPQGHWIPARN